MAEPSTPTAPIAALPQPDTEPSDLGWRLWVHAFWYALLLVGAALTIPIDGSFGGDDGAYGGQVYALQQGDWILERPLPVVPETNEGWLNTAILPDGPTPYTSNPAYAVLLRTVADLGPGADGAPATAGDNAPALAFVPLFGAWLSAIVAWLLAADRISAARPGTASDRRGDGSAGRDTATRPGSALDGRSARSGGRTVAPLAFWLVALGPVLVNGTTLWAHTLATALGGASLLFVLRLARARALTVRVAVDGAGLVLSLLAVAVIRTESVFWLAAIGLTAVVVVRRRSVTLVTVVACGIAGLGWFANRSWGQAIRADRLPIETAVTALQPTDWLDGRLPAAWRLLLTSLDGGLGPLLSLVTVVIVAFAVLRLRRASGGSAGDDGSAPVLVVGAAALFIVHAVLASGEAISGTIAAWPLVALLLAAPSRHALDTAVATPSSPDAGTDDGPVSSGVLAGSTPDGVPLTAAGQRAALAGATAETKAVAKTSAGAAGQVGAEAGAPAETKAVPEAGHARWPVVGPLVVPVAVLMAAVLATQYAISGGHQWGGRYLSVAFVPMAVGAALRGGHLFDRASWRRPLVALLVAPAIAGLVASHQLHTKHRAVVEAATAVESEVVVTEILALPRIAWTALPTAFYVAENDTIGPLLQQLAAADVASVNVVGFDGVAVDGVAGYRVTTETDDLRHLRSD